MTTRRSPGRNVVTIDRFETRSAIATATSAIATRLNVPRRLALHVVLHAVGVGFVVADFFFVDIDDIDRDASLRARAHERTERLRDASAAPDDFAEIVRV